ncbi:FHA domain-containing protein [Angustibacter sp. Root456]|uniref:FHA domain-containing protein n=1 Tax=Angustibacter sp. Root456 TaxID=1736539 RepID=UPI0006FF8FDC|nr:FHA domain-containing protein [Angustibacter sp. Root456]KQX61893.1 hypothetical protein ASD06_15205 [Angustibacter sp. Root456]
MRPHAAVAPGPWTLVHGTGLVVLLDDAASAELVDGCRSAAACGDLDDVLDAALAGGVRAVPDLAAVALSEDGARVVVRGGGRVVVEEADGAQHVVEAAGARPWRDVDLAGVARVALLAPGQEVASAEPLDGVGAAVGDDRAAAVPVEAAWPLPPSLMVPAEPPASAKAEPPPAVAAGEARSAAAPDDAAAFSYDFLFGATERGLALGGVAAAPAPSAREPVAEPPAPTPGLVPPRPAEAVAVDLTLPPPTTELTGQLPTAPGSGAHDHAGDPGRDQARQTSTDAPPPLISSVPWRRSAPDDEPAPAAAAAPVPVAPVPVQQVSLPARPQPEPTPPAAGTELEATDEPEGLDELDEATVDRAALLAQRPVTGPEVLAVLCPAGHPSPAHATRCRVCGRDVPAQTPYRTPRPPLGVLTLSTGDVVTLDRGVLLGRAPTLAGNVSLGDRPHVVKVASPDKDISRNHAQFALEGWHVLVSDLGSTNGTTVQLPGQDPVRLRPGDQQPIEPGTVVVLADEVSLVYEVTP